MRQKRFLFLVTGLLLTVVFINGRSAVLHPVHTSVTQMQYNATEKSFEVSIRLFTDDLETALTKENNNQRVRLSNKDNNDVLLERYLRKHFALVNARRQRKAFQYLGREQEADATWVYVEIPYNEPIQGSMVQQSALMDAFSDQMNLVNVSYLTQKKTLLFKQNNTLQELSL